ncbi:uncharacterized protein [Montipora foliosa]|uniref:uncharacterized protein n=1 Tax=Montipora foliosa TaxID=591990 RepID=UPI0035F18EDF
MPKSFLVKKTPRNKRKHQEDEDTCEENEEGASIPGEDKSKAINSDSNCTGDVAIQCNLESGENLHVPNAIVSGGNQPNSFPALDTRGLHTLAELCLRRADYEFCAQNVNLDSKGTNKNGLLGTEFRDPRSLHEPQHKRLVSDSLASLRPEPVKVETKEPAEEKCEDLKERRKQAMRRASSASDESSSRLHKLEEELEKMLQGKEEIIGREIRDFMENNKVLEKELIEETGVTQTELKKYLHESVILKEDKRKNLFRWYLEKKLSRMESDDESYTCYKCGKIFAYESYLERHVKYVCPDKTGRTWKCSYCSKAFQYPCYLRRHMRSHTGESPYKCTQCSRAFVRSTDLQRHLRNHTGEKPYKCQECSRAFARSTDLKRHMRTHTGEKPYKCWQCSKAFSQSGSLQTHLHTHFKESLQMKGVIPDKTKRN